MNCFCLSSGNVFQRGLRSIDRAVKEAERETRVVEKDDIEEANHDAETHDVTKDEAVVFAEDKVESLQETEEDTAAVAESEMLKQG